MNKKSLIIIVIIIIIIAIPLSIYLFHKPTKEENSLTHNAFANYNTKFSSDEIIALAKTSKLYDQDITLQSTNTGINMSTQNEEHTILVKENYYSLELDNTSANYSKFLNTFGAIIDATQNKYGLKLGDYNETYQKIINRETLINGTEISFQNNTTLLAFNYNSALPTYAKNTTYTANQVIPLTAENYEINLNNLKIFEVSAGYSNGINLYSVCAMVNNPDANSSNITVNLISNQTTIATTQITITPEKYTGFCADFNTTNFDYTTIDSISFNQ